MQSVQKPAWYSGRIFKEKTITWDVLPHLLFKQQKRFKPELFEIDRLKIISFNQKLLGLNRLMWMKDEAAVNERCNKTNAESKER